MHDSHIHLVLDPLQNNLEEAIQNFKNSNGKYILTQSTDLVDIQQTIEIGLKYPEVVDIALGLHPTFFEEYIFCKGCKTNIYEQAQKYILKFETILRENREILKAVGETGLDYYQFALNGEISKEDQERIKEIQKISFKRHIQLALEYNLPISVHARDITGSNNCVKDCVEIIAQEGKGNLRGSFHSYTGDISFLDDILSLGFYVGFNGIVTYNSGENVREILKKVPLEKILLETDGPFLPPQSVRKDKSRKEKYAQPSDIREILETVAKVKNEDSKRIEDITDKNYITLFH